METIGKVNISDIRLVVSDHDSENIFKDPVFTLDDGTPIYTGDTVDFYINDDISPTNGVVQNINGLKIACFNNLLYKWRYYDIINNTKDNT